MEILQWYDFLCPQSYIGQHRTAILVQQGHSVVLLPFQSRQDVPAQGLRVQSRNGPMYSRLATEAKEAGLRLNWSTYLPNTRGALACAEWVRLHQPAAFPQFHKNIFDAHFVLGENISDPAVIERHAKELGIDVAAFFAALAGGAAGAALREAESRGRESGVKSTPAWLIGEELVTALIPAAEFERLGSVGSATDPIA